VALDAAAVGDRLDYTFHLTNNGNVTINWVLLKREASIPQTASANGFHVVAFSSPVVLGVDTLHVTLPSSLGAGAHRLALYAPDGTLYGWRSITVAAPTGLAGLAITGFGGLPLGGAASALVLLGVAGILAGNRKADRWQLTANGAPGEGAGHTFS